MKYIYLILILCVASIASVYGQYNVGGTGYTTLSAAVAAVPATGVQTAIELSANVIETTTTTIAANQNVLLKSSGGQYTIKLGADRKLIKVATSTAALTLENIILDGGAVWSDNALTVHADTTRTNSGLISKESLIENYGKLTLNSGTVIQNHHLQHTQLYSYYDCNIINRGQITLNDGTAIKLMQVDVVCELYGIIKSAFGTNPSFTMNGNSYIAGCRATTTGDSYANALFSGYGSSVVMNDGSKIYGIYGVASAVTQRAATFTMNGTSSIYDCYSDDAALVGYTQATINMNDDVSVHDNYSTKGAGGVRLFSNSSIGGVSSTLNMNNKSSIYNNRAATFAGGISNYGGWINMNDMASVHDNAAGTNGGGIYVYGSASAVGELNITSDGCKIYGNKANISGGICAVSNSLVKIYGGEVSGNNATNVGGIYASGTNCSINISGGKIISNEALASGGGVGLGNGAVLNFTGGEISGNTAARRAGGLFISTASANSPVANVVGDAVIKDNNAPTGNAVYMCADKAGGPASVFNLDGKVPIVGDIYLEKDTLNGSGGDFELNKYVTLVSVPTRQYSLVTNPVNDSPYGRIVVVPGTTTVNGVIYSITDAMPYTENFSHNVRLVVEGIPGEFSDKKLMLGGSAGKNRITITPDNTWPETDGDEEKPAWNTEYDNVDYWYCGCDMTLNMYVIPDPYIDRTISIDYLGALKKGFVVDSEGNALADSYTLAKNDSVFTLHFVLLEDSVTSDMEGQKGAITMSVGGSKDTSLWFNLYRHPSYEDIFVRPYIDVNGRIDLGIKGGTPNLMRRINGGSWRNAYEPLSASEKLSVIEGASIWLREPYGCWERKFLFVKYGDMEIQRYIDIPLTAGVTTVPSAGKHYVEGHDDFSFTASYANGSILKVMATGYYSGKQIELTGESLSDGTYKYTLYQVVEPWHITFVPEAASGTVGNSEINDLSVWAYGRVLHISSNADTVAYIYTISGSLYKRLNIASETISETLPQGVYIVTVGDKRYKVMIK